LKIPKEENFDVVGESGQSQEKITVRNSYMHEVSLVEGIIDVVNREKKRTRFKKVLTIEIGCGPYNCVSEESLQFYFDMAVRSTYLHGARLVVRRHLQQFHCRVCGTSFKGEIDPVCPVCKRSEDVDMSMDNSIRVTDLEVE